MRSNLRVPYTQQFSPNTTPLAKLVPIVQSNEGDRARLCRAIARTFFAKTSTPPELAANTVIALKKHEILDDKLRLTAFGRALAVTTDQGDAHRLLAKHILRNSDGFHIVETLREMRSTGEEINLTTLPEALRIRGIRVSKNSSDLSNVLNWFRKAGLLKMDGYEVNEEVYQSLVVATSAQLDELKALSREQISFLRALVALGVSEFTPHNIVCQHAEALYGGDIRYNWKAIDRTVLKPLSDAGYIELRSSPKSQIAARGGKPSEVRPTKKLREHVEAPILESLARAAGYRDLREITGRSWSDLVGTLESSSSKHERAEALEILTVKICQVLDLEFMGWRVTDEAFSGGGEIDAFLHSSRLIYSRWQVQCKASDRISYEAVAKEVGAAQVSLANVILIVCTGTASTHARTYRDRILASSNLNIVFIEREDLRRIVDNPGVIVDVLGRQARDALRLKPAPSDLSGDTRPSAGFVEDDKE